MISCGRLFCRLIDELKSAVRVDMRGPLAYFLGPANCYVVSRVTYMRTATQ